MLSDIEISQQSKMKNINEICERLNINEDYIEYYGKYKAKIDLSLLSKANSNHKAKLILVTAITPTPLGEGKSTTTIGLVDSLCKLGKKAVGALREPSLGPVFGVKGGAAGGGYAQVNPMADLNLHFTGDLHAITSANNLISACIDNHIYQGNELNIDESKIVHKRCIDLNDRALREVIVAKEAKKHNLGRKESFNITVASEIMAILCLSSSLKDLRNRISDLTIAYSKEGKRLTVSDLGITGSVIVLLKDAIKPNLIQTLENNPVFVHGGPFANIAHGCNSLIATKMALNVAEYVVTEAGFGADLGAEKFLDIKCRLGSIKPDGVVVVATLKALKYHGGSNIKECTTKNLETLQKGIENLRKHLDTIKTFGLPAVVALNRYSFDNEEEIEFVKEWCEKEKVRFALSEVYAKGSAGGIVLAEETLKMVDTNNEFKYIYDLNDPIELKIEKIATKVYGATKVVYEENAKNYLEELKLQKEFDNYFICMAKTPLSLTDNPKILGAPKDFTIKVKEIRIATGSKFLIILTGDIMTLPGLPKTPLALKIDLDDKGNIINLS